MKFLCGNCKAKYQIADEKVTGRTLRMKCRRCGHDILIDGHGASPSSAPAPAPRRTNTASVVPPGPARGGAVAHAPAALPRPAVARPSQPPQAGLSADFRRHVVAPPEVPQRTAPYDLWHVAIQDVPVGPMTRDELARKIEAGAVVPESLCWREGMDDWRPLGELPELAGLLRRSRDVVPRAPRPRAQPAPAAHAPRAAPPPPIDSDDDEGGEPTRISEFMPSIAQGSTAKPLPTSASGSAGAMQAVSPAAAPFPAPVMAAEPARAPAKGSSGIATGIAIGMLAMILLLGGPLLYRATWGATPREEEKPAPAASAPKPVEPAEPAPQPEVQVDLETPEEPEVKEEEDRPSASGKGAPRVAKTDPSKAKTLSDEQKRLLERMGGGGNDPDLRAVGARSETGGAAGPVPAALTPAQLTKVVQENKQQLQRCYETALRAAGGKQEGAVKVTVSVVVGTSGTAKSVSTQGDGLGNMTDCLRTSVKRWRFPQAQGDSEFAFPLVFQPGA